MTWCVDPPLDLNEVMIADRRGGSPVQARRAVLEFPAGMIDEGEDSAEAARRELRGETGYIRAPAVAIGKLLTNPTRNRT